MRRSIGRWRSSALAVLTFAALAACAAQPGPRPTLAAPAAPLSANDALLFARVLKAADERRSDPALVDSALRSGAATLRAAATLSVGQVGDRVRAPLLRRLLADPDSAVAASAAFALGLLRDSASVPVLATALSGSPAVAIEAAWALGEIGAPARTVIEAGLAAGGRPPVTSALLLAAAKLRPLPLDRVLPCLRAGDRVVVRAAAYAIARSRAPGGVSAMLPLADARDTETREHVARALAYSAAGDSLADRAVATLTRLAADTSAHVRINAVRSLGGYGRRARPVLTTAVRDPDANVRIAAAQSFANVLPPSRRDWAELLSADTGYTYRASLVASALRTGVTLTPIDEDNPDNWQRLPDWRYRAAAADAASGTQVERVVEVALPLTRDPDGRVRAVAYGAFAPFADSAGHEDHPWRREFLLRALGDEDFFVRATVLGALVPGARAAEVPGVLASYQRAAADSSSGNDARVAAIRFIASAWRNDSAAFSDSLRAAIGALPAPKDALERAEAKGIPLFAAWAGVPLPTRPLAFYEEVVRDVVLPTLAGRPLVAEIATEHGAITLELLGVDAPLTVQNFVTLAHGGFYQGTRFHRVVPNFVAQDGDPRGDGNGGPGYAIRDELNRRRYDRGAVGMALSGPDTGGSQYFLTLSPQPHLDGHYTIFARVVDGYDAMDRLVQGDRIDGVTVR